MCSAHAPAVHSPDLPLGALRVGFVLRARGRFGVDVRAASGRSLSRPLSLSRRRLLRFIPASLLRLEHSIGVSSSASAVFHSRTAPPPLVLPPIRLLHWQTNTAFILLSSSPPFPSRHPFSSPSSEQALCSFLSRITQSAHALATPPPSCRPHPPHFRHCSVECLGSM